MKHAKNVGVVVYTSNLSSQEAITELWVSLCYSQTLFPNKIAKVSIQRNNRTIMGKVFMEMSSKKTGLLT